MVVQRLAPAQGAENQEETTEGRETSDLSFDVTVPHRDPDGEEGTEHESAISPDQVTGAMAGNLPEAPEVAEGEEVALPDMNMPEMEAAETDAVTASVSYSGTIANQGTVNPFGSTTWANFNITDIKVKKNKTSYAASFKVKNPITYNVAAGGRTNITSATDGALTAANFATAASDLTPNMADLGGRPPRTMFWAQDLTLRHEKFHSRERKRYNGQAAKQAQTWLKTQTANSATDVQGLIAQIPGRMVASSQASVGTLQQKEARAYGDGVSSYKSRAKAISKRGAKGKYP